MENILRAPGVAKRSTRQPGTTGEGALPRRQGSHTTKTRVATLRVTFFFVVSLGFLPLSLWQYFTKKYHYFLAASNFLVWSEILGGPLFRGC